MGVEVVGRDLAFDDHQQRDRTDLCRDRHDDRLGRHRRWRRRPAAVRWSRAVGSRRSSSRPLHSSARSRRSGRRSGTGPERWTVAEPSSRKRTSATDSARSRRTISDTAVSAISDGSSERLTRPANPCTASRSRSCCPSGRESAARTTCRLTGNTASSCQRRLDQRQRDGHRRQHAVDGVHPPRRPQLVTDARRACHPRTGRWRPRSSPRTGGRSAAAKR